MANQIDERLVMEGHGKVLRTHVVTNQSHGEVPMSLVD